jgi:hypothetical protein
VFVGEIMTERELPLRLWAAPIVVKALNDSAGRRTYCLGCSPDLVLVLCNKPGRCVAIVVAEPMRPGSVRTALFGASGTDHRVTLPPLQLIRTAQGSPLWYTLEEGPRLLRSLDAVRSAINAADQRTDTSSEFAKLVVDGIREYYRHQVLEPSVQGFLRILEKQFPRSDLYVFELLQNAIDEGARRVRVRLSPKSDAITFEHDGASFTPLDVLGLSSVGLSTKSNVRSVGFMGIGFKATYKRFRRVRCVW